MNIAQQRAAFEAWVLNSNPDFGTGLGFYSLLSKNGNNEYTAIRIQYAWEAWQAALESPEVEALRDALQAMLEVHGVTQAYAEKRPEIPQSWVEVSDLARAALAAKEKQK